MSTEPPGVPPKPEHIEQATIDVSKAEVWISPGARRITHRLAIAFIGLFVFVLLGYAATLAFSVSQAHINDCQRTVNTRFQQADIERATATQESAQAQVDLWQSLFSLHGTQAQRLAQFTKAFDAYKAKLAQVTAIRYPPRTGTQSCAGKLIERLIEKFRLSPEMSCRELC